MRRVRYGGKLRVHARKVKDVAMAIPLCFFSSVTGFRSFSRYCNAPGSGLPYAYRTGHGIFTYGIAATPITDHLAVFFSLF